MITNHTGYYVLYRDNQQQWRWTFRAANHRVIAVSSEAYVNKSDCVSAMNLIANSTGCAIHEQ
ncbi:MAG: YegP family protein [Chthoniobacterales bacterium]